MIYTPYVWPLIVAAVILAGLALYVSRFKDIMAARWFSLLTWAGCFWALSAVLEISTTQLQLKILFLNLRFPVIAFSSPIFLALALEFTGSQDWLTRTRMAFLVVEPTIVSLLAITSTYHNLFRYDYQIDLSGAFPVLLWARGPFYWLHIAYVSIIYLVAFLTVYIAFRSHKVYLWETLVLGLATLIPWATDFLFNMGITPIRGYNLTPTTFIISGLLYIWVLDKFHLFEVTPVAREIVFENIDQLVVVLDNRDHLVDFNRAAEIIIGLTFSMIGRRPDQLAEPWLNIFTQFDANQRREVSVGSEDQKRTYDLSVRPLIDNRQRILGRLFIFHDVTQRKRSEDILRQFSQVIDQGPASVVITDRTGVITYVNARFTQTTGYTAAEAVGQTPRILKSGQTPQFQYKQLWDTILSGVEWKGEFLNKRKDGSLYWENALVAPVKDVNGRITHFIAIKENISGRKQIEKLQQIQRDLGLATASAHTMSDAVNSLLTQACKIGEIDSGVVYLSHHETHSLELVGHYGLPPAFIQAASIIPTNAPFIRKLQTMQQFYWHYADLEFNSDLALIQEGARATALLPVTFENDLLALIMLFSHTQDELTAEACVMLETLAAQMGAGLARLNAEQALQKANISLERQVNERTAELSATVANLQTEIEERQRIEDNLRRAEQGLVDRVTDQSRKLAMLYEVILVGGQSLSMQEILEKTLEKFVVVMGCHAVCLHQWDQNKRDLQLFAQRGISEQARNQLGLLQPENLPSDNIPWIAASELNKITDIPACLRLPGFDAFLGIPIHLSNKVVGILSAFWSQPIHLSVEDIALFSAIADQLAILLENVRLRLLSEETAARQERRRLARDLHDSVTQSLHSLVLASDTAHNRLTRGDLERLSASLDQISESARQALKEMRLLLYELRLSPAENMNLIDALESRLDVVERRTGMDINLSVDGTPDWPAAWDKELYPIAIEALNNSLKHAQANHLEIIVRGGQNWVELEVVDNGKGMDLSSSIFHSANRASPVVPSRGGLGLSSMQERAEKLNGSLEIISKPGTGTRVRLRVPKGA